MSRASINTSSLQIRKAPRQRRSQSTVDSIKQATLELVREQGFGEVNAVRIAEHAGVSVGSLYQYFPNREAIYLALFEDISSALADSMKSFMVAMLELPLDQAVPLAVQRMLDFHREHELVLLRLVNEVPELHLATHPVSYENLVRNTLRIFIEQQNYRLQRAQIDRKIFVLQQIILGTIRRYLLDRPERIDDAQLVGDLSGIVTRYIRSDIRQ